VARQTALEQLAQRDGLALVLRLELGIGDVLVLPHHHDGFAVERRVLHDIGRSFLSTAVQGLDV
jgi:hypothetical protein